MLPNSPLLNYRKGARERSSAKQSSFRGFSVFVFVCESECGVCVRASVCV